LFYLFIRIIAQSFRLSFRANSTKTISKRTKSENSFD